MVAAFLFLSSLSALSLVPRPQDVSVAPGVRPSSEDEVARAVAAYERDASIPSEGYRLSVDAAGVRVWASSDAGAFYAGQTLRQLQGAAGRLPHVRISDAPKFPWRGVMLDEARHFFGKAAVLKLLETMAQFKLNVLHWHLTDDQGWRFPVPGFPELTRTARPVENRTNFRDVGTGILPPQAYTQEDIREIIDRARELQIRIVPEIDLPGHAAAVLSVEHHLGCFPPQEFAGGGPADKVRNVLCPGRDDVLRFGESVLDAVCDLFPDPVVHLGGDECDRANWARCAKCQARMKAHGLKDVAELQAWFTGYFCRYLARKGRRLLGWDEIAEGGLPASAMVMSWRGTSTGILAAKGGHEVVMTPNEFCYFDYEQCLADDPVPYPFNWTVPLPLAKVYSFDPLRGIPEASRRFVLGGQCNNWTEMTCTADELEWKLWPRAAALAEVLWSYPKSRDFADFSRRMEVCRAALRAQGVNAAPVALSESPRPRGTLTRTGNRLDYVCGATHARLAIEDGDLVFSVNGKRVRDFTKDGRFVELEAVEHAPGAFFVTARRDASAIVATFRFEGEAAVAKDRWDDAGPDKRPLDVQALVDEAAARGGGEAFVPAGQWRVKPFSLKSNVTLRLDDRAEIHASEDLGDYSDRPGHRCFVYTENATNVAIVGKGLLDGHGYRFRQRTALPGESQPQDLPLLLRFSRCRDVRLEGIALVNAGAWACHLRACDGVRVKGVRILNHVNNTNDGIDIESANVVVEGCDIDTEDDAVCLKSESDPSFPVTNVVVQNCRLASCCNAFKIGTGTYGDIRDVRVESCRLGRARGRYGAEWHKVHPGVTNCVSGIAGVALEVVDGGALEAVTVRDIELEGYAVPFFVRQQRRHEPAPGRETQLSNILVENVRGCADSRIASSVTGVPGLRPRGITFRNVDLTLPGGGTEGDARRSVPERETAYPDAHMFDRQSLPAYGFYVRHADDVTFENVTLRLAAPDARERLVLDDVTGCSFTRAPSP